MSLLTRYGRDVVTIYPEVTYTDADGNTMTRPSTEGITVRATLQPEAQSGTSSRRREQDTQGFETEAVYRMRLHRNTGLVINAQARIEWGGEYWAVVGDGRTNNGSPRTKHTTYSIRRT